MKRPTLDKFYRFTVDGLGIYEVVDRDCPKDDPRRKNKPDGSWLHKIGSSYPGAISFWTHDGLKRYKESGLFDWHTSVVNGRVKMLTVSEPTYILYQDEYQIMVMPKAIQTIDELIESVKFVVAESSAMSKAILNETFPITSVTIFSHSDSEFEILKGLLQQLGKPFSFNNGPRVVLHKPITFGAHKITHVRIRRPDVERPQMGCNDFDTEYVSFKDKYLTLHPENLSLITRPEYEMIEFHHPEFNVLAYVVSN